MKRLTFASLNGLHGQPGGLTKPEVDSQRKLFGENVIVEASGRRWQDIASDTLRDPMLWFLLSVGSVFFAIGQSSEGITLFVAILPLALMDLILHWRTEASTAGLKSRLATTVMVMRDGEEKEIAAQDVVPGDLLKIRARDFMVADGILQFARKLQVDESTLTGEAFPIQKKACGFDPFARSQDGEVNVPSEGLIFAGTKALTGSGEFRILFTGASTEYGAIVQSVSQSSHDLTPLQAEIARLVRGLVIAAIGFCIVLGVIRLLQGHGWLDALLSAATLAVAAMPEEFPIVFTFFLGVGVYRLARRRALVRRAVTVENIGRVTQLCADKTGTITTGELKLAHIDPSSEIANDDVLYAARAASSVGSLDPVDAAIHQASEELRLRPPVPIAVFPFTEDRKRETAILAEKVGRSAYTKGAPENILAMTALEPAQRQRWLDLTSEWAGGGHKVLAAARKTHSISGISEEPNSGFEFCGLLAFEDPPRSGVVEAIRYCYENGVHVLMITGDHLATGRAIGRDIGLHGGDPRAAEAGSDESMLTAAELGQLDVVARCTPAQKLAIVRTLKAAGEIVAVTGDGVNDVPALKAADVGIAMGLRGTRSAKEVSSIILGDDNFKTIVAAIREGRDLFVSLRNSFEYLLLIHLPFVLTAALVPMFGYPLLYLPVHIVWLELIIHPTAILAFQRASSSHQRHHDGRFFDRKDIVRISLGGMGLAAAMAMSFILKLEDNVDVGYARAEAMAILTLWSCGLTIKLTEGKSIVAWGVAVATLATTVGALQISFFTPFLHVAPLYGLDWLQAFAIVLVFIGLMRAFAGTNRA